MKKRDEIVIRPSKVDDFDAITRLWLPRKRDPVTMRWLHQNPDGSFRSYVADAGGKVVGHIGYVMGEYTYKEQIYKGVFSIEWLVDEKFKHAALPLYSKILKIGDFTFVIGGTEIVNKIYPLMKFKVPVHVCRFLKVIKPFSYLRLLNNKPLKKWAKTVFYSRGLLLHKRWGSKANIKLVPYESCHDHYQPKDSVSENAASEQYLDWLLNVPGIEAYPFLIFQNDNLLGKAFCYVEKTGNVSTGRIVHISYLGDSQSEWCHVLQLLENFLKTTGCCIITAMASHDVFVRSLKRSGFIFIRKSPFWLRDRKNLFKDAWWHLTYIEGDMGYRNMYLSDFKKGA